MLRGSTDASAANAATGALFVPAGGRELLSSEKTLYEPECDVENADGAGLVVASDLEMFGMEGSCDSFAIDSGGLMEGAAFSNPACRSYRVCASVSLC